MFARAKYLKDSPRINKLIAISKINGFEIKDVTKFYEIVSTRPNFSSELNQIIASSESNNTNTAANLAGVVKGTLATQTEVPTELFGGSAGHKLISTSNIAQKDDAANLYQAVKKDVFSLILSEAGSQLKEENIDQYLERVTALSSWTEYIKTHFQTTLDENGSVEAINLVKEALAQDLAWIRAQKFDQLLSASLFIDKPFYDGLLLTGDNNLANAYDNFGQSSRAGDSGAWQSWINA